MLGKSVAPGVLLGALLVFGCARTIAQDKATTADGKPKGAKPMVMENGEAKATGIVTYPGGDRVDWKLLELPEGKRGTIELKLTWTPPRPGLQLAFDVFDEWGGQAAGSKKTSKKRAKSSGKIRTATVSNAKGKYFVRVFAVGRGDAGKYRLSAEFKEATGALAFDALKLEITDPPKLAAVPEEKGGPDGEKCSEFDWDVKKEACKSICPATGAPPGWPPCKGKCPTPPDVNEPACWKTMPCPKGAPDERIVACKPKDWPPCPDKNNPDLSNPNCRVKAAPVVGRIVGTQIVGNDLIVRVGIGTAQGIKANWNAVVIQGPNVGDAPVPNGTGKIESVDAGATRVRPKLNINQATDYVRFSPP